MSAGMPVFIGAAAATAAAEAAAKLMRQEEEEMTPYSDKELAESWEFKIVRGNGAIFRKPEQLRAVLDEERKGGWTLVEKFDDCRIRLKRPAGAKLIQADFADGYDPYRTTVGISPGNIALVAAAIGFVIALSLVILVLAMR